MYEIIWSEDAKFTYREIQKFVLQRWSIDIIIRLDNQVEDLLERLRVHHRICPLLDGYPGLRKCVINKQNSLIYRIDTSENTIHLVTFIDNRMNHPFFN